MKKLFNKIITFVTLFTFLTSPANALDFRFDWTGFGTQPTGQATNVIQWFLNSFGLFEPVTNTTYTGPTAHWVADSTGTLINQAGLVSSAGESLPPIRGATIATTEAGGATLGPELVTNGGFDADASWTKGDASVTISGGKAVFINSAASLYQNCLVVGRRYTYSAELSDITDGSLLMGSSTPATVVFTDGAGTNTTYTGTFTATSANLIFQAGGSADYSLDNISVREVIPTVTAAGDAMVFEATTTNLLLQSNAFMTTWTNNGRGEFTKNAVGPDGITNSAWTADVTVTGVGWQNYQLLANLKNSVVTVSVYAKPIDGNFLALRVYNPTTTNFAVQFFNIASGTVAGSLLSGYTVSDAGCEPAGNGFYRCWLSVLVSDHAHRAELFPANNNDTALACTSGHTVLVYEYNAGIGTLSSPIPTTTAATTRNPTDLAIPTPAAFLDASGFQGQMQVTPKALPGTDQVLLYDPTSGAKLYIKGADNKVYWLVGAKEVATAALTANTTYDLGWRQTAAGASISLDQTVTTDATMTTIPAIGAALEIGSAGNANYFTGEIAKNSNGYFLHAIADKSTTPTWFSSAQ